MQSAVGLSGRSLRGTTQRGLILSPRQSPSRKRRRFARTSLPFESVKPRSTTLSMQRDFNSGPDWALSQADRIDPVLSGSFRTVQDEGTIWGTIFR